MSVPPSPVPSPAEEHGHPEAHGPAFSRAHLPDHASHADDRGVTIDRVGISGLRWPITVWDREERLQNTVATITATVTLPASVKGTHMSRFVEVLNGVRGELSLKNLPGLLAEIQRRLDATSAQIDVTFPYFMTRHAPVSRAASLMEYGAAFHAERRGNDFDFELEVTVPVTTLCPCSKAVSARGAHNQRGLVTVRARPRDFMWIEDVVEAVEACASSPLYALLKREDEKWVTEHAYDHPVFVEDLIREVVGRMRDQVHWMRVTVENLESIHNHSAFATLEWCADSAEAPPAPEARADVDTCPTAFGAWVRSERTRSGWSQQELAARLGISAPQLSKIEAGQRRLPEGAFDGLAEALGVSPTHARLRAGIVPPELLARLLQSEL